MNKRCGIGGLMQLHNASREVVFTAYILQFAGLNPPQPDSLQKPPKASFRSTPSGFICSQYVWAMILAVPYSSWALSLVTGFVSIRDLNSVGGGIPSAS